MEKRCWGGCEHAHRAHQDLIARRRGHQKKVLERLKIDIRRSLLVSACLHEGMQAEMLLIWFSCCSLGVSVRSHVLQKDALLSPAREGMQERW